MGSARLAFAIFLCFQVSRPLSPTYARWLLIFLAIHSPSVLAASITQLIDEVKLVTSAALSSQLSIYIPVKIALPLN